MSVIVPVVNVGIVSMLVDHRRMSVQMRVGLLSRIIRAVPVLVVLVMDVAVFVLHRLVRMLVVVNFGQVKV